MGYETELIFVETYEKTLKGYMSVVGTIDLCKCCYGEMAKLIESHDINQILKDNPKLKEAIIQEDLLKTLNLFLVLHAIAKKDGYDVHSMKICPING